MSQQRDPSSDQPLPKSSESSKPVGEALKELIDKRTALGISKYGTPLMTSNGRDAGRDALEEAVDLCQYLMQIVMERDADLAAPRKRVAELEKRSRELERDLDDEMKGRDAAEAWADRLAACAGDESVIGEHSNINNPWAEAEEVLFAVKEQNASLAGRVAELEGRLDEAHRVSQSNRELAATHRCKACGALWIDFGKTMSLASYSCGACCDNAGIDQLEPVGREAEVKRLRNLLRRQGESHESLAMLLSMSPTSLGLASSARQCRKFADEAAAALAQPAEGEVQHEQA